MRNLIMPLLVLLSLIQGCEQSSNQHKTTKIVSSKIINGSIVLPGTPAENFNIFIMNNGKGAICSGSLIASNVVLTAAHCVKEAEASDLKIFTGSILAPQFPENNTFSVRSIFAHPDWVSGGNYDIALLELEAPLDSATPIAIFDGSLPADNGIFPLEVYGYSSYTKSSSWDLADYFRQITREETETVEAEIGLLRLNGKLLSASTNPYEVWGENLILVQQLSGGVCHGDSGGPMVVNINGKKVQVAINKASTTFGKRNFDCNSYSLGTYLVPYLPWINEQLKSINVESVATAHFDKDDEIVDEKKSDTTCVYIQESVVDVLQKSRDDITNNICNQKTINHLEQYLKYAEKYCNTDLSNSYQFSLMVTIKSLSKNCK